MIDYERCYKGRKRAKVQILVTDSAKRDVFECCEVKCEEVDENLWKLNTPPHLYVEKDEKFERFWRVYAFEKIATADKLINQHLIFPIIFI